MLSLVKPSHSAGNKNTLRGLKSKGQSYDPVLLQQGLQMVLSALKLQAAGGLFVQMHHVYVVVIKARTTKFIFSDCLFHFYYKYNDKNQTQPDSVLFCLRQDGFGLLALCAVLFS